MDLFIRINDGQPFEHPILAENFVQAFPGIDVNNLPPEFARFERVARPTLGTYEVMDSDEPTYELVDGIYKDVWHKRDMTEEERLAKQQAASNAWAAAPNAWNFTTWVFNEETCTYDPPVPKPEGETPYFWQGTTNSWVERPSYPTDDKNYKFDLASWSWIEVTEA